MPARLEIIVKYREPGNCSVSTYFSTNEQRTYNRGKRSTNLLQESDNNALPQPCVFGHSGRIHSPAHTALHTPARTRNSATVCKYASMQVCLRRNTIAMAITDPKTINRALNRPHGRVSSKDESETESGGTTHPPSSLAADRITNLICAILGHFAASEFATRAFHSNNKNHMKET